MHGLQLKRGILLLTLSKMHEMVPDRRSPAKSWTDLRKPLWQLRQPNRHIGAQAHWQLPIWQHERKLEIPLLQSIYITRQVVTLLVCSTVGRIILQNVCRAHRI